MSTVIEEYIFGPNDDSDNFLRDLERDHILYHTSTYGNNLRVIVYRPSTGETIDE